MADVQVDDPQRAHHGVGVHGRHRRPVDKLMLRSREGSRRGDVDATEPSTLPNDAVFTMIGREPPLDFLRRSGVRDRRRPRLRSGGSRSSRSCIFCVWMYHWKKEGVTDHRHQGCGQIANRRHVVRDPKHASGSSRIWARGPPIRRNLVAVSLSSARRASSTTLAYAACVVGFGIDRIRQTQTPYVMWQTLALMLFQVISAVPAAVLRVAVDGPARLRSTTGCLGRWSPTVLRRSTPPARPRVLAGLRPDPRLAAVHLERVHRPADVGLADPQLRADVRDHPADHLLLGQGRVLRLGLLVRGTGGNTGRSLTATRCPTARCWNRLNMLGQVFLLFAFALLVLRILGWSGRRVG